MSLPDFLRHPDFDWSPFSARELTVIGNLRQRYRLRPLEDRDFAAVPLLNDKGEAMLVKLTIDLVEPHARRYWSHYSTEAFSFPADD